MRPCSRLPFYQASLGAKNAPAETAQAGGAAGATRRPQGTHGARLTFSKETEERAESAATAAQADGRKQRGQAHVSRLEVAATNGIGENDIELICVLVSP